MIRVASFLALAAFCLPAQTVSNLNCTATAVPALVRLEGLAEQTGDIVLNCSGGTPNGNIRGNLSVISFGGNVTNKLNASTGNVDAVLTVNTGAGETTTGAQPQLTGNNRVEFTGMNFNLSPTGTAVLRITNFRVVPPQQEQLPFQVALATNGPSAIRVDNSPLTVGIATRGLLSSYSSTFFCTISPIPQDLTFLNLLRAGTRFASIRFTEGFGEAFIKRGPLADSGTRLLVTYSGFPAGSRLFVPDVLAGSSAAIPTAGGDLGLPPNGGRYLPNSGQLLLSLVRNNDANGAGGTPVYTPAADFNSVSEITLTGGRAVVTYEVIDSNPAVRESVQLPTFLGLANRPEGGSVTASVAVSFGPVSIVPLASSTAPVPRFQPLNPPPDCQALGDCNSGLFPKLVVESEALNFNPIIGQFAQTRFIRVLNDGGGLLNWAANIQYKTGSGWLTLDPTSGVGNATLRLDATANGLQPGTYEATLTIDAGPIAGTTTAKVTLEARPFTPPPTPAPEVTRLTNAATFEAAPIAPGTLATIFGKNLTAKNNLTVTINNMSARLIFSNDTQINLEIPPSLPTNGQVPVVVTVDGRASSPINIQLATASPGIFTGAVLNQDYSVNAAANPARSGSFVQIYLTGLPTGPTTVRIHDRAGLAPAYAGPAPGFPGLQQVNVQVPADLQTITSEIAVCSQSICSPPRAITVQQP